MTDFSHENGSVDKVIVDFYYKDDCHLCERMQEELAGFLDSSDCKSRVMVNLLDIESNDTWYERYREYVPVLVVNEEEVCHYFLDGDDLTAAIAKNSEE